MTSETIPGDLNQRLTKELARLFDAILTKNQKIINEIDEMKTIAGWYHQAGENPDQIPSIIVNKSIERLLETVQHPLANYLIDKIKVQIEVHSDGVKIKVIEIDFAIKPFVEYVKKVNDIESNKIRVTFSIVLEGKLEGIAFHSNYQRRQMEVNVESVSGSLTVSIVRATGSILYMPAISMGRPVLLYTNEFFKMQNVSFNLPM